MGDHYTKLVPTAEAHVYPNQGHLSVVEANEAGILDALAGSWPAVARSG